MQSSPSVQSAGVATLYRAVSCSESTTRRIEEVCKNAYRALQINGYARVDLRLSSDNEPFVIEVNPNPDIGKDEDFASSAEKAGLSWEQLIQAILSEGIREAQNGD